MNDVMSVIHHPFGIIGIALIVFSIGLSIWNIFVRDVVTPYEFVSRRDARIPDLLMLKSQLRLYFQETFKLTRDGTLYNLNTYGLEREISFSSIFPFSRLYENNKEYLKLKLNSNQIPSTINSVEEILERLDSKKLKRYFHTAFEWEHKARSQQIAIRLFRTGYEQLTFNENKLLIAENHIKQPNLVKSFNNHLKHLYSYIGVMERGEDII